MKNFAVIGNPIAHSRSPEIHQAFAEQTGIALTYRRLQAPITADGDGFTVAARTFFAAGGDGMNVTAPFKEPAFRLAASISAGVRLAAAANTLTVDERGGWHADNTDGIGLARDLTGRLKLSLAGCRILVLGAGGASAGILGALLDRQPAQLALWNRTADKAQQLVRRFAIAYPGAALSAIPDFPPESVDELSRGHGPFDLVIHATSLRKESEAPEAWPWLKSLCSPDTFFYDLGYADAGETLFLRWVKADGAHRYSDGFGMLVEQAAESFQLWHGVLPDTARVFTILR